jgi:hypothetical protein
MDPCGLGETRSLGSFTKKTEVEAEEGRPSLQRVGTPRVTRRNIFTTNTNRDKVAWGRARSPTEEPKIDWPPCVMSKRLATHVT